MFKIFIIVTLVICISACQNYEDSMENEWKKADLQDIEFFIYDGFLKEVEVSRIIEKKLDNLSKKSKIKFKMKIEIFNTERSFYKSCVFVETDLGLFLWDGCWGRLPEQVTEHKLPITASVDKLKQVIETSHVGKLGFNVDNQKSINKCWFLFTVGTDDKETQFGILGPFFSLSDVNAPIYSVNKDLRTSAYPYFKIIKEFSRLRKIALEAQ